MMDEWLVASGTTDSPPDIALDPGRYRLVLRPPITIPPWAFERITAAIASFVTVESADNYGASIQITFIV